MQPFFPSLLLGKEIPPLRLLFCFLASPIFYQRITFADDQDSFISRISTSCGILLRWKLQDLPGSWITLFHICPALRPRPGSFPRPHFQAKSAAPMMTTMKAPTLTAFRGSITRLLCSLSTLHIFVTLMCKTRFRLLVRLYRVGFAPTGLLRKFQRSFDLIPIHQAFLAPCSSVVPSLFSTSKPIPPVTSPDSKTPPPPPL